MNNSCGVCGNEVGKAHKCMTCQEFVHIFCGKQIGSEGYGQHCICKHCETAG